MILFVVEYFADFICVFLNIKYHLVSSNII